MKKKTIRKIAVGIVLAASMLTVGFAVGLMLTVIGVLEARMATVLANILMAALLVVFTIRLAKTRKFMPAGLMVVLTIAALALRNIHF